MESVQFSSVAQSCPTLCNPMDCSTPGFSVHHQLLELPQTHVHRVGDAIKPSHPLSSPFLLPSTFPSIRVFSNESVLWIRWPKYWSFSFSISLSDEYSGLISFRIDWFDLLAVQGTLRSLQCPVRCGTAPGNNSPVTMSVETLPCILAQTLPPPSQGVI